MAYATCSRGGRREERFGGAKDYGVVVLDDARVPEAKTVDLGRHHVLRHLRRKVAEVAWMCAVRA